MRYFVYSFSVRDRCLYSFTKIGAFLKASFLARVLSKIVYVFRIDSIDSGFCMQYWYLDENFSILDYLKAVFTSSKLGWLIIKLI